MTDGLDRDELIRLLEQLGDESDQTVLSAARAIHAGVAASGQTWDDLLVGHHVEAAAPAPSDEADVPDEGAEAAEEIEEAEEAAPVATGSLPDDAESLRLIDRLLAATGISEELRAELGDYKADIEAGEFSDEDRKYLRALHRRLKKE